MQDRAGNGGWATLAEAASALGVSVITVRRALKRGELEAKQVTTPHGPTWLVWLDHLPQGVTTPDEADADPGDPTMLEMIRLVSRLEESNRKLAAQVGHLQAKLTQAQERVRVLERGRDVVQISARG